MIYTSSYRQSWNNEKGTSISRGQPKGWIGSKYLKLAPPTWEMVRMKDWDRFKTLFNHHLATLNVHATAAILNKRVLLCWENVHKGQDCHRTLVREWFNTNGYECEEVPKNGNTEMMQMPLI